MFVIKLAEHCFTVDNVYPYTEKVCRDYIIPAADENAEDPVISISREELEYENQSGEKFPLFYLESLAVYRKISEKLLKDDIVLFHGSAIAVNGKAVIFAGNSGAGKSTHARMWRERYGSLVTTINDDKPLVAVKPDEIRVYGTPYAGKENLQTNISAPLTNIVFIKQAPENSIRILEFQEAYPKIANQTYRTRDSQKIIKAIDLALKIAELPVYELSCTPTHEAAELVYKTLQL